MRPARLTLFGVLCVFLAAPLIAGQTLSGQTIPAPSSPQPLIVKPINDNQLTVLRGNTHPLARPQFDQGAAPSNLPMDRMLLVLKRSPEQGYALGKLLDDQQDKASRSYHQWLTPDEFGRQFGPSDQDIQLVTGWLQSHGFQIAQVSRGRTVIEFSGTAAQVQQAFHTAIHKYVVNGENHWANASDPQIPTALTPVVAGVHTLHNFVKKPMHVLSHQQVPLSRHALPQITGSDGSHALVPGDYAVIYNINPVYQAGIDGTGATIAVVGRSDFDMGDISDFRSTFALPSTNVTVTQNGPDPGIFDTGEQAEATLDVSWSGAVAPNATVNFVVSATTNTTDGVDLSELYIVDNNLGDVMTESFGTCEANPNLPNAEVTFISTVAQQAAAQGITFMVSSGDTGSAGCANLGETTAQGQPISVNLLASTPFHVAVGGTLFNEHGQGSLYWNPSNNPTDLHSAKSYIPENAWNETCTGGCPQFPPPLASGGGGASILFSKPSWQSGVVGIPNDSARDVPDVSLTAAGHDGYLLCLQRSCASGGAFLILGTSASAPSFAGIMALVDQKMAVLQGQSKAVRQGQANYVLYRLAATQTLSQCNGSKTTGLPASNCIFNDVTTGNNGVPGEPSYGTSSAKYQSTPGYDLATGLGSVNVNNLVNNWSTVTFNPTSTTLGPISNITHGQSVNVNVSVSANGGGGPPTGDVTLISATGNSALGQHVDLFPLTGGAVSSSTNLLPGGSYTVTAHYSGDATFAPSDSTRVSVAVAPEGSTTTASVYTVQNNNLVPFTTAPYGSLLFVRADVAGNSGHGTPSGTVQFLDDGSNVVSYSLNSEGNILTPQSLPPLPAGQHAISARYLGDASFNASTSPASNITITQDSTTTSISSSSNSVGSGSSVTLTATINATSFGNAPRGTVRFFSGNTQLGNAPATIASRIGDQLQSTATLTTSQLPNGQDSVTAQYGGDTNYVASTSSAITITVQPDFSVSTDVPTMTINGPGNSGSLTLMVAGQTGYNGTINFTAASCSGLPRESHCNFNPASVNGSGNTLITVQTTKATPAMMALTSNHLGRWATSLGTILACVFVLGPPSRRRRWTAVLPMIAMLFLLTGVGCGGGNSSSGGGGDPGTPRGSFAVTVTATTGGGLTHTTSFTLTVN